MASKSEWINVDQALSLCIEENLPRTKKTIRSWCRNDHVMGQKQTTSNGERWLIDKASLSIKIKAEKEMQTQYEQVSPSSHSREPLKNNGGTQIDRDISNPKNGNGSNPFEPVQSSADQSEQVRTLEQKLQSLEIDKTVRDQHISFLNRENEKGREDLLSQSRYIGHLETKVVQLGGTPDQTFLAAPTATSTTEPANPTKKL